MSELVILVFTLRILAQALEICIGNHTATNNPFHWHHVQINLPCTYGYDPSLPHVHLIRFGGEEVVRIIVFFDDRLFYGLGAERVQSELRKICAGLKFLGNQEAAGLVPAQDVHFFYTHSHFSALQKFALLLSASFQFIFTFKNTLHNLVIELCSP